MGLIDHLTVSIYIENEDRDTSNVKSTIKFGSMDKIGLKYPELYHFRTKHKGTWDLIGGKF